MNPRPVSLFLLSLKWFAITLLGIALLAFAVLAITEVSGGTFLRQPVSNLLSKLTHRQVSIGNLDLHLLSLTPSAKVTNFSISNPSGQGNLFTTQHGTISISLPALLTGNIRLPALSLTSPSLVLQKNPQQGPNWRFGNNKPSAAIQLPVIESLSIRNGQITYTDQASSTNLYAELNTTQQPEASYGFTLIGQGTKDGEALKLNLSGGNLQGLTRNKPYPINAQLTVGESVFTARGHLRNPSQPASFQGRITLKGDDLATLYDATGITLPNTPPYNLKALVIASNKSVKLQSLSGKIGDSDIAGTLTFHLNRPKLFLEASLTTQRLDFDDIATFFGAAPTISAGETASTQQRSIANRLEREQRLFPDATLQVDRLRAMNAKVSYQAAQINLPNVPLESIRLNLELTDGILSFNPLALTFKQGNATGTIKLDASQQVPQVTMDMRIPQLGLESFFPVTGNNPAPLSGNLVARLRLNGEGNSVRQVAANADGQVTVVIPQGEMRRAFAELMGINLATGLGLLLSEDQSSTPIRCAVIDLRAQKGILTASTVVFDTGPVLATGTGQVNLKNETLSIRLQGQPKEPELLSLLVPITITGNLRSPQIGAELAEGATQAGGAIALGALLSPLAAILPFINPGLAEDANCSALLQQAKSSGAPVSKTAVSRE